VSPSISLESVTTNLHNYPGLVLPRSFHLIPHTMSSSRSYSLVEPHPHTTAPYVHTARGGAGNTSKPTSSTNSCATPASIPRKFAEHKQPNTFKSGRGGAGNVHYSSERAIFSFDEELERQMRQQEAMAPVYHVGRGGAGNMIYADSSSTRQHDPETLSARSTSSTESGVDIATRAVRRSLEKGWAKVAERF
jgi:Protein of unknown function (DUF3602)